MTNQEAMRGRAQDFCLTRREIIVPDNLYALMATFALQEVASRDARIAELEQELTDRDGIILGLQDVNAGRVRPLDEIEAALRKKHGVGSPKGAAMSHIKNWFRKLWATWWLQRHGYCFEHKSASIPCFQCFDLKLQQKKERDRKRAEYPDKMIAILKGKSQ